MTEAAAPSHRYYQAMVGRWSGRLTLVITDRAALASASMSAFDRLIWRLTALAERIFGAPWFETSVAPAEGVASDVVVHTTRVRSLFLTMVRGTEILTLDPDGRRFTMSGEHRFLWTPWRTRRVEGVGEVDADAEGASYSLSYLGAPIVQKTRVVGRALAITQTSAFGRSEVRLERVAA